jgi:hypothetical protein
VHLTLSINGGSGLLGTRPDESVSLAFSPDGRYLALAQRTPEVHLWDVLAGREVGRLEGHEGRVVSLLFAPDGKHLFSGSTDTTARAWDLTRLTQPQQTRGIRLQPEALDALWADLGGKDPLRAFDALRKLSASPDQAVKFIKDHLYPETPADAHRLTRLVADLGSDRVEVRRLAESDLGGLGDRAEPALRQALDGHPPLELRQRVERLLDKLLVPTAGQMRELRAVELLEWVGTTEARLLLRTLAGGVPGTRLTREAASAVRRLTQQAATP